MSEIHKLHMGSTKPNNLVPIRTTVVGGTTQRKMLLIPLSDKPAWVADIVRHIPRD